MKYRKRILFIILTVVICTAGILLYRYSSTSRIGEGTQPAAKTAKGGGGNQGSRVIPVKVYVADYITIEEGIRSMGTLVANEEVDISSEIAGKVEKIYFDEGSRINKGQIMIKVNDDDLQSQLKRSLFQRKLMSEKLERNRILLEKDAISREAFDQIETDFNMNEADIQLLEVRIDKTEIKAPFAGVVGFKYISPGSYLQPSTPIAKLVDYSKLKLEFSIPEKYISPNLRGMDITFTTENSPRINKAKVYAVDSKVDIKTRTITLRALYDNADGILRPGMFAKVSLGGKSGQTIAIPTEAIISEAQGKSVWTVKNNRAVLTPVVTATRTDTMVEVTKGLAVGDSVIITGLMQLREGSEVQVND